VTTVPSTVSPGQVVTASHQNDVRTALIELQADRLLKAGGTMTGALLLPTTQDTGSTAAIHKGYADATYATVAGDTMTGPLILPSTQSTNPLAAIHTTFADGRYVNVTGDTLTGPLLLDSPQSTNGAAAIRKDYADATYINDAGDTMTGSLEFGAGGGPGFSGIRLDITGHIEPTVATNISNIALNKISAADVSGGAYIVFETGTSGGTTPVVKSSISRNAADNGIAISNCNTTAPSDYRLKNDLGPVVDGVARVMALVPRRLRWKTGDDPAEWDGFFAHEVTPVAPYAVIGDKDAVYPPDSEINPGQINPQQLDVSGLVPLLVAALQEAVTTITDLTARVTALEAG
jgi:hypothetical protein